VDYDPDSSAATGGIVALIVILSIVAWLVVVVGIYVLHAIGFSRLFRKTGIESWIGWVPYYNVWKLLELGGQPGWMVLIALIPGASIVLLVFLIFAEHRIGIAFGKDTGWTVLAVFLPWLWAILLSRDSEVYDPRRLAAFGYPPPTVGYGASTAYAPNPGTQPPPPSGAPRA
jgi:hypothetical protein